MIRRAIVILAGSALILVAGSPAMAAEAVESSQDRPGIAAFIATLTLLAIGGVMGLVVWDRSKMRQVQLAAIQAGMDTSQSSEEVGGGRKFEALATGLQIVDGATEVEVGATTPAFNLVKGDAPFDGQWAVEPADRATLDPENAGSHATSSVKVKGKKPGLLVLRVSAGGDSLTAPIAVLPKVASRAEASVSALGSGIGGFVVAMTALGLAATLGAINQLGSEVATIIGAALGAGAATGVAASKEEKASGEQDEE